MAQSVFKTQRAVILFLPRFCRSFRSFILSTYSLCPNGNKMLRLSRFILHLITKPVNVYVHYLVIHKVAIAPHLIENV